ncbi:hypothetical protein PF006_g27493 [Phytophthora fragariae]|uniref:Uncharacterized protein n=1 Tax=Phytophthora fragariae TaxID=53985 RepID=A0A6A3QMY1_9STRA|nr:hypothetical protein PF006_g27493 [Phytophthora fragariae]
MHLNGYNNAKAVLDWALENFPDPKQLVIGGYSAGSLGAQIWSVKAAKMWEVGQRGARCRRADLACVPDRAPDNESAVGRTSTKFQVLADKSKTHASSLVKCFGGCDLSFPASLTEGCKVKTVMATEIVDSTDPQERVAVNTGDATHRMFNELARLGIELRSQSFIQNNIQTHI